MPNFAWMGQEQSLSSAALTIRAQTLPPNDLGRLLWDAFFPRRDVSSVVLRNITPVDYRPTADRREWNARGRYIPTPTPRTAELEMVPVEAFYTIAEREAQALAERTMGNQDLLRQIVMADIPERTDMLAGANYRRLEVDAFTAWALGQTTAKNPQTNTTQTFAFGFDPARYTTQGTSFAAATNGYQAFMTWLRAAIDLVGPVSGVMLRQATLNEIQADAPNAAVPAGSGITPTLRQVEQRITDEIGTAFTFYVNERTVDIFNNAGTGFTRTKVWPARRVAAVPQGEVIGDMAFAPVARAVDLARENPRAGIDVRGMTVYQEVINGGRGLTVECQANAMPIPDENKVAVTDAGV